MRGTALSELGSSLLGPHCASFCAVLATGQQVPSELLLSKGGLGR
jgi:hypothetical protein